MLLSEIAEAVRLHGSCDELQFVVVPVGNDARLSVRKKACLDGNAFTRVEGLTELSGERVVVAGIGGGSDIIQATQLAHLLEKCGKKVVALLSVREAITGSVDRFGNEGQERVITNYADEPHPDLFEVTSQTSGSGRFLEHIPADSFTTYLLKARSNDLIGGQLKTFVKYIDAVDAVYAVDTGGDCLFSVGEQCEHETPDQDLKVLMGLSALDIPVTTVVVACGVDAPHNAHEVLQRAGARYYSPTEGDVDEVLSRYEEWNFTGKDPTRFGLTPFAWQAALRHAVGYTCLPLPERVVIHPSNPWNPFVCCNGAKSEAFEGAMRGVFFMELSAHLGAIGAAR